MPQRSKRYREAKALVQADKVYEPEEAVSLIKRMPQTKFDAAVEVHIRLGIDVKQANQLVRGSTILPHGLGKQKRIAVFCGEAKIKEAKAAGATLVGGEELIKEIQSSGRCDFDIALATPDMMKALAPIAKILGQKGLMPNPKTETITMEVGKAVTSLQRGKVNFKGDDSGNVHQMIGKVSFEASKILENFNSFIEAVRRARPAAAKGSYFVKVTLATSMSPGVSVKVS